MVSFKRLICAVRGHEDYLHFEKDRVYLQCVACGYESPGWTVDHHRPVLKFKARKTAAAAPTLVKKIA
jgi:hypothetical protein